mmetsp:Transcript_12637/g.18978  ORF Transcript_12637/g.18978 Transcript_12637/m.18978 type:complete len:456 (+) Transcript_12637:97-1464(+)
MSRYDRYNDHYRSSRSSRDRRDRSRSRSRSRSPARDHTNIAPDVNPVGIGGPVPPPGVTPIVMPGMQGTVPALPPNVAPILGTGIGGPGLPPGVPNLLVQAQAQQAEKINRELFVGNIPPGTSDMLLREFLNGAMRRTGLCAPNATPILQVRVSPKFAFCELVSYDDANKALNLNGIPFMGIALRVSRPSKYTGPYVPSKTWQQLTGQPLPAGMQSVPENGPPGEEKINRELFVGNTTPEMTEESLKDFLGKALEQVGLVNSPGNPINSCRMSGKFAFIELRTVDEAKKALNLNNIPYMGATLRVGRPSKWTGEHTPHGNWEDILAKYMSGELQLPAQPGQAPPVPAPAAPDVPTVTQTKVVALTNMLTKEDLQSDQDYEEILEDTKDECSGFGSLVKVEIPRSGPGEGKIFLQYVSASDATKAIEGLRGRTFDGRKVAAVYFSEEKFSKGDYTD